MKRKALRDGPWERGRDNWVDSAEEEEAASEKKRGRKEDRGGGKSLRKLKNKVTQMPGQWEVRGLAECGKSQSSQNPQAQSVPTAATPRAAVVTPREGSSGLLTCQRLASVLYNPPKDTLPPGTRSLRAPGPLLSKAPSPGSRKRFLCGWPWEAGRALDHDPWSYLCLHVPNDLMCLPSPPCASGASSVERAGLAHPAPHSDPVVKLDHTGNGLFMTAPLLSPTQSHSLSLAFTHPSSPSVPPLFSSIFSFPPFLPLSLPLFLSLFSLFL